jgi:hypothetical protein
MVWVNAGPLSGPTGPTGAAGTGITIKGAVCLLYTSDAADDIL